MIVIEARGTLFCDYQQNGILRLWDATSGMWIQDITDPQLVTVSITSIHFDSSITMHQKARAQTQFSEQQLEIQGAIVGTSSGVVYSWTSEATRFTPANYSHASAVAAIIAPRGAAFVLSIDMDGVLIKGVWGPDGTLIKRSETDILSLSYRYTRPFAKEKSQAKTVTPLTPPAITEIHLRLLEHSCVVAYGPGLYILDSHNTGVCFLGLQSPVLALACEHNVIGIVSKASPIISIFGYYKNQYLLRIARLINPEAQQDIIITANYDAGKSNVTRYLVTTRSFNAVSLFALFFPPLEKVTQRGTRIPSLPPILELRCTGAPGSAILTAIPHYLKAKSVLHIVQGTHTVPTLTTEEIPADLLADYLGSQPETDLTVAKIITQKRILGEKSLNLLRETQQALYGVQKADEAFFKFTRFNESNPAIKSTVLPKASTQSFQVQPNGFRSINEDDNTLPIEQVIAQNNKHRLHTLLTTTSKQARITTAKMLSDEGVHNVFAALLKYADNDENSAYIADILVWIQTLIEERPTVITSDRSIPALSGFKSLFHKRISYRNNLTSLAEKLQPLRFSDEVLNDLRRQVEQEEAQNQEQEQDQEQGQDDSKSGEEDEESEENKEDN